MAKPLYEGDQIICATGHPVAKVVRDVKAGDMNWTDAVEWLQEDRPTPASQYKPGCEECGAAIFDDEWRMRIQGWRP